MTHHSECAACGWKSTSATQLMAEVRLFRHIKTFRNYDAAHQREWRWAQERLRELPKPCASAGDDAAPAAKRSGS